MISAITGSEGIYLVADIVAHALEGTRYDSIRNDALGALKIADVLFITSSIKDLTSESPSVLEKVKHVVSSVLQVLVVVDILDTWGVTDLAKFSMSIGIGFSPLVSGAVAATCFMQIIVLISSGKYSESKSIAALVSASTKLAEQILVLANSADPKILLILALTSSGFGLVKVYFSGD